MRTQTGVSARCPFASLLEHWPARRHSSSPRRRPVRAAAAAALERLGPEAVDAHLVAVAQLLADESSEAKAAGASCLGEGGAVAARLGHASALAPLLKDVDDDVRGAKSAD